MVDFKKGFMTTLGVLTGISVWAAVCGLFAEKDKKTDAVENEKTENRE